eukprot:scpid52931/ scgid13421/ 
MLSASTRVHKTKQTRQARDSAGYRWKACGTQITAAIALMRSKLDSFLLLLASRCMSSAIVRSLSDAYSTATEQSEHVFVHHSVGYWQRRYLSPAGPVSPGQTTKSYARSLKLVP